MTDRDPYERAAINYCVPHGIPWSRFMGAPVYSGFPEWTDDDRAAVFEWLSEQAGHCSDCNLPLDESMATENAYAYKAEALWCHGCRAIHRAAVKLAKGKEDPLAGTRYRVHKLEEAG